MTTDDGSSDPCCDPVPDTAMATGSEDGEPGDQPDARPLTPDESALLADLQGSPDVTTAVEDSATAARAVANDSVLPAEDAGGRNEDDPLTPEFRAPPAN
ncbi:MAG: hypothetical protein M3300_02015 [Actinomycetota bacterium]|jgi:hypothetical protein|nr:hypothetical protein [Actinomycetota bacterium]